MDIATALHKPDTLFFSVIAKHLSIGGYTFHKTQHGTMYKTQYKTVHRTSIITLLTLTHSYTCHSYATSKPAKLFWVTLYFL